VFGSLGLPELILIFVVALLLFGPRQLPQIGRSVGRALGEFRRASNDFKRTIEEEVAAEEIRDVHRELKTVGSESAATLGPAEPSRSPSGASAVAQGTADEQAAPTTQPAVTETPSEKPESQ
jgi:Tat protein translocase TatB subunit